MLFAVSRTFQAQPLTFADFRQALALAPALGLRFRLPTGALTPDQIATLKRWVDEGADWPDAVSGDAPAVPADPGAEIGRAHV